MESHKLFHIFNVPYIHVYIENINFKVVTFKWMFLTLGVLPAIGHSSFTDFSQSLFYNVLTAFRYLHATDYH